jgi:hypothetical protein
MRTLGIWVSGLLASALVGGLIGNKLGTDYSGDSAALGGIAGMCAFACVRLWLGQNRKNSN